MAIVFGLTVSTFLTRIIVPTFYSLLEDWVTNIKTFFSRLLQRWGLSRENL